MLFRSVRINWLMGHRRMFARALGEVRPARMIDLGAGDGRFALGLARALAGRGLRAHMGLIDRAPCVSDETQAGFARLGWSVEIISADVFAALESLQAADAIFANLFLHHLDDATLARLFALAAAKTRVFVAAEPCRSPFALLGARAVVLLGATAVTRHDAVASVRAGFRGRELSPLWPSADWRVQEKFAPPFTHLFAAVRDV